MIAPGWMPRCPNASLSCQPTIKVLNAKPFSRNTANLRIGKAWALCWRI
jgi:hypothetical protein